MKVCILVTKMHRPMRYPLCLAVIIISAFLKLSTADETRNFCFWTKITSNGESHHSFLRHNKKNQQHSSPPSHRLYHSVWAGQRTLVNCAWSDDTAGTEDYLSLCQKNKGDFSDKPDKHFDIRTMLGPDRPCVVVTEREEHTGSRRMSIDDTVNVLSQQQHPRVGGDDDSPGAMRRRRVKRSFIVPGTLWCGSGTNAAAYSDLGVFAGTDSCCREHDQCKDTILSFESNYGVFNANIFTMSHCDCDKRFRRCLLGAQDSISDVVGYTFFNLLKLQCFEFSHRLQCAQRNWFGMCQVSEMVLYAVVHPPTLYNSTHPDSGEDNMAANTTTTTISTTMRTAPAQLTTGPRDTSTSVTVASSTSGTSAGAGTSAPASPTVSSSASVASPTLTLPQTPADTSTSHKSTQGTETASVSVSSKVGETALPTQKPRTPSSATATFSKALFTQDPRTTSSAKHTFSNTLPTQGPRTPSSAKHTFPNTLSTQDPRTPSSAKHTFSNTLPTQDPRTPSSAKRTFSNALPLPEQNTTNTGKPQVCEMYRDLDVCRFKILPWQKRYGLHNPEPRTLYHCNCTSRLFQGLSQQKEESRLQTVLLGYVSQSCFSLRQDCIKGTSCTAALIQAPLHQLEQKKKSRDMEEGRHLEASKPKVRKYRKAKRMDRPVRLHKLCVRMTQPKVPKRRTLHQHGSTAGHA